MKVLNGALSSAVLGCASCWDSNGSELPVPSFYWPADRGRPSTGRQCCQGLLAPKQDGVRGHNGAT
jgi:hypothetical protein